MEDHRHYGPLVRYKMSYDVIASLVPYHLRNARCYDFANCAGCDMFWNTCRGVIIPKKNGPGSAKSCRCVWLWKRVREIYEELRQRHVPGYVPGSTDQLA